MLPTDFPEANKTLPRPPGWTVQEATDLIVWRGAQIDTGRQVFFTYWKPSVEDLNAMNDGKGIYLKLISHLQVPVHLQTENPFPTKEKPKFWVLRLQQDPVNPMVYHIETMSGDAEENYFVSDYYFDDTDINMLNWLFENTNKPTLENLNPQNLNDAFRIVQEHRTQIIEEYFAQQSKE